MSQLGNFSTKKFYLPSTDNEPEEKRDWVVLRSTIFADDLIEMQRYETVTEQTAAGLARVIVEWSYTDDNDKQTPITYENVCHLDVDDFNYLSGIGREQIEAAQEGLSNNEKKTSSDSSAAENPSESIQIPVSSPTTT